MLMRWVWSYLCPLPLSAVTIPPQCSLSHSMRCVLGGCAITTQHGHCHGPVVAKGTL